MLFPPGDIASRERRSRWRETEFMYHEICAVLLPPVSLTRTLSQWNDIVRLLSESKRSRPRQLISTMINIDYEGSHDTVPNSACL